MPYMVNRLPISAYIEECERRQLFQYGEERARAQGIGPEDMADLVEEYQVEAGQPQA